MLSKNLNSFLRPLKNKGFKEATVTKIGLYDIVKSTTLESNKSLRQYRLNEGFLLRRRPSEEWSAGRGRRRRGPREPTRIDCEGLRVTDNHRALDHVLELTNVSRPRVGRQQLQARRGDASDLLPHFPRIALNEVRDQQGDVC